MVADKMVWTKWYGQNGTIWTKWYTDKMVLDKMTWTNGTDKMSRIEWYG